MTQPNSENYIKELKEDFRNFLYRVWKHLKLPDPTPVQYDIANLLQHGGRRKIIEGYRGVGKSWITSVYVLWRLLNDPNYKALVVSASKTRADAFSAFTKRLIRELPELKHLEPQSNQRDSMVAFDVAPARASHSPSVKSVGIFGQLTGSRATEIIADDVEVPNNSGTQDQRDKLMTRVLEFEAIIMPEVGKVTYLGTPQTEESVYNKLSERGYQRYIFPARYPSVEGLWKKYQGDVHERLASEVQENPQDVVGKPTDPLRFSNTELIEKEGIYGRSGFALQYMLDTSLSDAEKYPLKSSDLIIADTVDYEEAPMTIRWSSSPKYKIDELPTIGFTGDRFYRPLDTLGEAIWEEYSGSVMAIDPSGRGADETTYAVVKYLAGYLWVLDVGGVKGGYDDETLKELSKKVREFKVNTVLIESNFGDGMFTSLFQPVLRKFAKAEVVEVRHNKQKEKRIIDTMEPVMNRHKLVVAKTVVEKDVKENVKQDNRLKYSLFYQMTRLTKERGALRHDDKIDVLSMACNYWVESMVQDADEEIENYREELLDRQLEDFMELNTGGDIFFDEDDLRLTSI